MWPSPTWLLVPINASMVVMREWNSGWKVLTTDRIFLKMEIIFREPLQTLRKAIALIFNLFFCLRFMQNVPELVAEYVWCCCKCKQALGRCACRCQIWVTFKSWCKQTVQKKKEKLCRHWNEVLQPVVSIQPESRVCFVFETCLESSEYFFINYLFFPLCYLNA